MNDGLIGGLDRGSKDGAAPQIGAPVIAFFGDSITINGGTKTPFGVWDVTSLCWPMWASMLSGGKFLVGRIGGAGSQTAQMLAQRYLPDFLADPVKPGYVVVLAGTNDGSGPVDINTTKSHLLTIWQSFAAQGTVPILCTLTPRSSYAPCVPINNFIRLAALRYGWPLVDFAATTSLFAASSGDWASGYSGDSLHPNAAGAKAMGQILADRLAALGIIGWAPPLTAMNADSSNIAGTTNAVMATDTNVDGVPDGWTISGSGATCALASASGVIGNEATFTRTTANSTLQNTTTTIAAGDWLFAGMRVSATLAGASPTLYVTPVRCTSSNIIARFTATVDIPVGCIIATLVQVPSGLGSYSQNTHLNLNAGDASSVKFSQPTVYNLTAQRVV